MTTFEVLVSVSQTLLRANGRWYAGSSDEVSRRDISDAVRDVARLLRNDCNADQLIEMAIAELERRATPLARAAAHTPAD